ncbi:polyhydroxyalkanoic acid system family protein [Sorangium sp. So ce131]|uniref:polyhydroxyalkanoic acid system family protein n=1 Tax=Sorangium sp. So ce131 TaxID=3133282 RepID=UPI003F60AACB
MKHTVHHDLDDAAAKRAVQRAIDRYCRHYAEYCPSISWNDERRADLVFSVKGCSLAGRIEIRPRAVDLELDVPLKLRLFKRMAISAIDAEVRRCIDEAHRERARSAPAAFVEQAL